MCYTFLDDLKIVCLRAIARESIPRVFSGALKTGVQCCGISFRPIDLIVSFTPLLISAAMYLHEYAIEMDSLWATATFIFQYGYEQPTETFRSWNGATARMQYCFEALLSAVNWNCASL